MSLRRSISKSTLVPNQLYDDAVGSFSLRRYYNWSKGVVKVMRSSDSDQQWVYFNGNNFDLGGKVGETATSPGASTFADFVGTDDFYVKELNFQNPTGLVTFSAGANITDPILGTAGVINTVNGKPAIDFTSSYSFLECAAFSALDYTNEYTVLSITSNRLNNSLGAVFCTTFGGSTNYFSQFNDRRTQKRHSIVSSSGTTYAVDYLAQQNNSNQKLLTTVRDSVNMAGYLDGTFQNSVAHGSASYNNTIFRLGAWLGATLFLDGDFQDFIVYPSNKTSALSSIHTDLKTYYSIP